LLLLSLLSLNIACSGDPTLVDDTRTFANNTWNRFTPEVFEFSVPNADDFYRIDFELVVDTALMRNPQLPLTVNLYSPDGERRMFYAYINLKEHGRWKGQSLEGRDKEGLRVIRQNIRPFFTFNNKGTYRMEIGQATSQYDLEGFHSFRLSIERTDIDYKALDD
jgi:hypothetical protein